MSTVSDQVSSSIHKNIYFGRLCIVSLFQNLISRSCCSHRFAFTLPDSSSVLET